MLLTFCGVEYLRYFGFCGEIPSTVANIIWMKELVWEALFICLESYSVMFDVDSVEGKE